MIESKLALCGESIVRDAETNAISVFNIIEELGATQFPAAVPKLSSLFVLQRQLNDPQQYEGSVTFSLDDEELGKMPITVDFEDRHATRVIVVIQGILIEHSGTFTVALQIGEQVMDTWSIRVHQRDDQLQQLDMLK
jgi:hypothetical protein